MNRPLVATILLAALVGCAPSIAPPPATLPSEARQLLVAVTNDWNSTEGRLQCFERRADGWRAVSPVFPILVGREGLAWGRGVLGADETGLHKVERDGRAPAGVFRIGTILGYDSALPDGADFPYHQVTAADAWVDDPENPLYNRHVRIDPSAPPPWFDAHRMRLGDPAFRWLIEVRHNSDPPVPGAGSAIFLHTRRGPDRPTAGCTALAQEDLLWIIRWLREPLRPHFVLLPLAEYERLAGSWRLPPAPVLPAEPSSLDPAAAGR
jgi:L,D-peptidoglycan transpeptidase YkuD (ErfK/YbiS/YcfS/YnhG family)